MNYKELINLGLSEKEAKVYLAALELGKSAVQKIAEKAGVNRATTYVQIESLMKKGLMSSYVEEKKHYFFAESPEKLSILFREEEITIQRKKEHLDRILPNLKAIKATDEERPTVRYFEGKEGLRAMSEEFFTTKHYDEARMIFSVDLLMDIFTAEEKAEMAKRRQKKGIKVRSIINDSDSRQNTDAKKYVIPSDKYPITSDIAFFGDKVRIATQKGKLSGIIIENKEICNTLKILFDLAWKYLKDIDKNEKSAKH